MAGSAKPEAPTWTDRASDGQRSATGALVEGKAVVNLAEDFGLVTSEDRLTVQLTPRGQWLELAVIEATTKRIVVEESQGKSGQFDYLIQGMRKGHEHHQPVRDKQPGGKGGADKSPR